MGHRDTTRYWGGGSSISFRSGTSSISKMVLHPMGNRAMSRVSLFVGLCALLLVSGFSSGCDTTSAAIAGGVVGTTVVGGYSPANEVEQVYYVGVFDPQEQVPPTIYRLTVHGQASAISAMKFASGWVPAPLADSLGATTGFAKDGTSPTWTKPSDDQVSALKIGRRMIMFGPEGFREAPANHRLVIVMGSSPEKYFNAIDSALGIVGEARREQLTGDLSKQVLTQMLALRDQKDRLRDVEDKLK